MIIDFHTHVFPPQVKKKRDKYVAADPSFALLYSNKKSKLATTEELIASMDEEGIEVSVILNIGWTTHDLCVETNDYILESIARYPDRLIGFGAVQPLSPEAAAREIERCAQGGMRGIGELRPDMQLLDLDDISVTEPFFAALRQHNLILLVHASEPVGHHYPGKGAVTPELLYALITSLPEHPIVCAHWGGGLPFYALMPEVKTALANVFFDTAASPFLYQPRVYPQVAELAGQDKILFGSDWPLLRPRRLLEEINSLDLSAATSELILAGNAKRLLSLERAADQG